ncbi:MAG: hypothetical protein HUU20_29290 [Pirellulales bacterium]|nr:hypothetical protein [Pirellulales bacterium]
MLIRPYPPDELELAWCYRAYLRARTYRLHRRAALALLDGRKLRSDLEPYGIHLLDVAANETDVMLLASLLPTESVAGFARKAKGRISSKWLREQVSAEDRRATARRSDVSVHQNHC